MTPTAFVTPPSIWQEFIDPRASPKQTTSPLRDLPAATPQASDIYSLGCVYLDLLTFLLRGKLTELAKIRALSHQRSNSDGPKSPGNTDGEGYFSTDSTRLDAWLEMLRQKSFRQDDVLFRGVPELLKVVRQMMSQNHTMRPSARKVRDAIENILVKECGIENLCCHERTWDTQEEDTGKGAARLRESIAIAAGEQDYSTSWASIGGGRVGSSSSESSGRLAMRVESRLDSRSVKSSGSARMPMFSWLRRRGPSMKIP